MDFRRWLPVFALVCGCFDPETASNDETEGSSGGTAGSTTTAGTTATSNTVTTGDPSTGGPTTEDPTSAATTMTTSVTTETTDTSGSSSTSGSTSDTDASSSGSSSSGTPEVCGAMQLCVETPPVGWDGPAARFANDGAGQPSMCADPLGTPVAVGFRDFTFEPAVCACSCAASGDATCGDGGAAVYAAGDNICDDALGGGALRTTCSSLASGFDFYTLTPPNVNGGSCAPQFGTTLPNPVNLDARTLCGPTNAPAACVGEAGDCLPETMDGQYCVSRAGDNVCPAGSIFTDRELIHTSLDDSRGCSQCSCGSATGTCTATASLFTGTGCTGTQSTRAVDGSCRNEPSPRTGLLVIDSIDASCAPSGGSPLGLVVTDEVVTLCCATL